VKITPAAPGETGAWPSFSALKPQPNAKPSPDMLSYTSHENVNMKRPMSDILTRGEK